MSVAVGVPNPLKAFKTYERNKCKAGRELEIVMILCEALNRMRGGVTAADIDKVAAELNKSKTGLTKGASCLVAEAKGLQKIREFPTTVFKGRKNQEMIMPDLLLDEFRRIYNDFDTATNKRANDLLSPTAVAPTPVSPVQPYTALPPLLPLKPSGR